MPPSDPSSVGLESWSTSALNLAEHSDNPVHTDEGARAAGFEAAIVAGTTVHAYLTHPVVAGWGVDWLQSGWSEVRFLAPVLDADPVECVPVSDGEGTVIEARVGGERRATLAVSLDGGGVGDQLGERLPDLPVDLAAGTGDYGIRAGDDLALYRDRQIAHPAAWTVIGNMVTKANCVDGPWVHVRSAIHHFDTVPADASVVALSTITDRFETRAGERVVLDVRIVLDGRTVVAVEHESIIRLAG